MKQQQLIINLGKMFLKISKKQSKIKVIYRILAIQVILIGIFATQAQTHVIRGKREIDETKIKPQTFASTTSNSTNNFISFNTNTNDPDIVVENEKLKSLSNILTAGNDSESEKSQANGSLSVKIKDLVDGKNVMDKLQLQRVDLYDTEETTIKTLMNGRFENPTTVSPVDIISATTTNLSDKNQKDEEKSIVSINNRVEEITTVPENSPIYITTEANHSKEKFFSSELNEGQMHSMKIFKNNNDNADISKASRFDSNKTTKNSPTFSSQEDLSYEKYFLDNKHLLLTTKPLESSKENPLNEIKKSPINSPKDEENLIKEKDENEKLKIVTKSLENSNNEKSSLQTNSTILNISNGENVDYVKESTRALKDPLHTSVDLDEDMNQNQQSTTEMVFSTKAFENQGETFENMPKTLNFSLNVKSKEISSLRPYNVSENNEKVSNSFVENHILTTSKPLIHLPFEEIKNDESMESLQSDNNTKVLTELENVSARNSSNQSTYSKGISDNLDNFDHMDVTIDILNDKSYYGRSMSETDSPETEDHKMVTTTNDLQLDFKSEKNLEQNLDLPILTTKIIETTTHSTMTSTLPDFVQPLMSTKSTTTEAALTSGTNENVTKQQQQQQQQLFETTLTESAKDSTTSSLSKDKENITANITLKDIVNNENILQQEKSHHLNLNQSGEKKPKFINDNPTNAQQLILPENSEVWTLAGMKMIPKSNHPNEQNMKNINNSLESLTKEKILLDWSQIMMNENLTHEKKHLQNQNYHDFEIKNEENVETTTRRAIIKNDNLDWDSPWKPLTFNNDNNGNNNWNTSSFMPTLNNYSTISTTNSYQNGNLNESTSTLSQDKQDKNDFNKENILKLYQNRHETEKEVENTETQQQYQQKTQQYEKELEESKETQQQYHTNNSQQNSNDEHRHNSTETATLETKQQHQEEGKLHAKEVISEQKSQNFLNNMGNNEEKASFAAFTPFQRDSLKGNFTQTEEEEDEFKPMIFSPTETPPPPTATTTKTSINFKREETMVDSSSEGTFQKPFIIEKNSSTSLENDKNFLFIENINKKFQPLQQTHEKLTLLNNSANIDVNSQENTNNKNKHKYEAFNDNNNNSNNSNNNSNNSEHNNNNDESIVRGDDDENAMRLETNSSETTTVSLLTASKQNETLNVSGIFLEPDTHTTGNIIKENVKIVTKIPIPNEEIQLETTPTTIAGNTENILKKETVTLENLPIDFNNNNNNINENIANQSSPLKISSTEFNQAQQNELKDLINNKPKEFNINLNDSIIFENILTTLEPFLITTTSLTTLNKDSNIDINYNNNPKIETSTEIFIEKNSLELPEIKEKEISKEQFTTIAQSPSLQPETTRPTVATTSEKPPVLQGNFADNKNPQEEEEEAQEEEKEEEEKYNSPSITTSGAITTTPPPDSTSIPISSKDDHLDETNGIETLEKDQISKISEISNQSIEKEEDDEENLQSIQNNNKKHLVELSNRNQDKQGNYSHQEEEEQKQKEVDNKGDHIFENTEEKDHIPVKPTEKEINKQQSFEEREQGEHEEPITQEVDKPDQVTVEPFNFTTTISSVDSTTTRTTISTATTSNSKEKEQEQEEEEVEIHKIPLSSTQRTSVLLNTTDDEKTTAGDKDGINLGEDDNDSDNYEEEIFTPATTTTSTTPIVFSIPTTTTTETPITLSTIPSTTFSDVLKTMEDSVNATLPSASQPNTTLANLIPGTPSDIINNVLEETSYSSIPSDVSSTTAKDLLENLSTLVYETSTTPIPTTTSSIATSSPITTMIPTFNNSLENSSSSLPIITTPSTFTSSINNILQGSIGSPSVISENINPHAASGSSGADVNVIIAITVSVLAVLLISVILIVYLMRKRQKQMSYVQRCRPVSLDSYSLDNVSVLGSVRRKGANRASKRTYGNAAFDDPSLRHNVLNASELSQFVGRRSSIYEEFRDVPQITARTDEVPPGCEDKNRYANVVPLPETRVILQQHSNDEQTEYINANYVRGPRDAPNYYIACQAPLESTIADFWRMIWEQQSRVIIQATDLTENGIEKCAEYLPPSVTLDNHNTYGDFQVILKNREVKEKYAISTVTLKNIMEEESREITHYWYKWPETGVPTEEAPIIAMLLEARSSLKSYAIEQANELREKYSTLTIKTVSETNESKQTPSLGSNEKLESNGSGTEVNGNVTNDKMKIAAQQGPLTVHCSPGTGRTGTIIACDMAIRSLETPKRSVDIPQIVFYVRRGRASAVQTKEQYEFIYKVANMYATKLTTLSNEN